MIDASIPMGIKGLVLPDLGGDIQRGLSAGQDRKMRNQQMQTQQMQNDEARKSIADKKTLEGVLSLSDTSTPEGQAQALKDLQTLGNGSLAMDLQTKFAQQNSSQQKLKEDKLRYLDVIHDMQNKYTASHAVDLSGLPYEQREAFRSNIVDDFKKNGLDPGEWADPNFDFNDKNLKQMSRISMEPKDRFKLELDDLLADKFAEIKPSLDAIMTPPEGGWNPTKGTKAQALARVDKEVPIALLNSDAYQQWRKTVGQEPQTMIFNPYQGQTNDRQTTQQVIGLENQLRDEYEKGAGESRTISRAGADIAAALKTNNPASRDVVIKKFAKLGDPTTGVLGGEANEAERKAMGDLYNRMQSYVTQMSSGKFSDETVKNFRTATADLLRVQKGIFQRMQKRVKDRFDSYTKRFPDLNLSPEAVFGSPESVQSEMKAFDVFDNADSASTVNPKSITKPEEEDEYQSWKQGQTGKKK